MSPDSSPVVTYDNIGFPFSPVTKHPLTRLIPFLTAKAPAS
jgi:hypothetical protein